MIKVCDSLTLKALYKGNSPIIGRLLQQPSALLLILPPKARLFPSCWRAYTFARNEYYCYDYFTPEILSRISSPTPIRFHSILFYSTRYIINIAINVILYHFRQRLQPKS